MFDRPLRLCMITTFYPPHNFGGDGQYVRRLSLELARRGHHVEIIYCQDAFRALSPKKVSARPEDHPNLRIHSLHSTWGVLSPLLTHQTGRPLLKSGKIRRIVDQGFDVIHFHNISLVGGPKVLELGSAVKLYTMHEHWLICPTHTLYQYNRRVCEQKCCWLCCLSYGRPPQWWRWGSLLRSSVRHVDAFIAHNRFTADRHLEAFPDLPIVRLPPFAPDASSGTAADRAAEDSQAGEPYFLFAGRLERLKGLHSLIPAFRRFHGAPLWIAGAGAEEPELRRLAAGSDVRFLGYQPQERLRELFRKALALIVPSVCQEISPLVILEAFREGTPVVARRIGGITELLEESGGGFLYQSEGELLTALERLSRDPALRCELGLRAQRAFLEKWTSERHLAGYLGLIDRIAATGPRSVRAQDRSSR